MEEGGHVIFPEKKRYEGVRLFGLRGGGWVCNFQEKSITQHLNIS